MSIAAIKYRCCPNERQQKLLAQLFGNQRFVYNWMLAEQKRRMIAKEKWLSKYDMQGLLPNLMAEYPWLQVSKVDSLRQACFALDTAIQRWRKKLGRFPRFKKKGHCGSITTVQPGKSADHRVWFSRPLRLRITEHRPIQGEVKRLTVSQSPSGRYYVSVLYETGEPKPPTLDARGVIGIDDGIETFVSLSTGRKIKHGRHFTRLHKQLARAQRLWARKKKGSRHRERQRIRVARLHERIANARAYETHLITTNLVRKAARESQAVAYQRTKIVNQMKNRCLAKAIGDAGWGELRRQLEYKCRREGIPLFVVDPFQATSKVCSLCGHRLESLPLHIRKWRCPDCGVLHDRDVNAAQVIAAIGWEAPELTLVESRPATVGSRVRPQGHSSKREGQEHARKRVEARK